MQRKLYKELWTLRFQKMLKLEEQSVEAYQSFLEECPSKRKGETDLQANLKTLIADEKKHAGLVQELLNIVTRQTD